MSDVVSFCVAWYESGPMIYAVTNRQIDALVNTSKRHNVVIYVFYSRGEYKLMKTLSRGV